MSGTSLHVKFCSGAKTRFQGFAFTAWCGPNPSRVLPGWPLKVRTGSPGGWFQKQLSCPSCPHLGQAGLTIHVTGHLAKHGQIGLIDDRAEYPPPAMLILPQDPLPGHAEGHHPHSKEEQEEEHIYQLSGEDNRTESGSRPRRLVCPVDHGQSRGPRAPGNLRHPAFVHQF